MPYSDLPPRAFWRLCRDAGEHFRMAELYDPKRPLTAGMRVATAGSCFAQNIGRYIRASDLELVDVEPAPKAMPGAVARAHGYGLFSARYGNIYTARQLRQLLEDAVAETQHTCAVWQSGQRWHDGLRPNIEPQGYASPRELRFHRRDHLRRVREIFNQADVFVFTLGLTEAWTDRETGVVFPTAPGVVAGNFDPKLHQFVNFGFAETLADMTRAIELMRELAPGITFILTVSPVPLTATATGGHVLAATTYSKSVLRAVAGELAQTHEHVDYFPSYEIITGIPFGNGFYEENLRSVRADGVDQVMQVFFGANGAQAPEATEALPADPSGQTGEEDELICEEAMIEAVTRS